MKPIRFLLAASFLLFGLQTVQAQTCQPGPTTLCLNDGRFRVNLQWATNQGTSGAGQAVALTPDTGYFWFFNQQNVEVVVKVLDACSFSGRFWVFAAGLTDVDVTMTVTDTSSGAQKVYQNAQGVPFQPIQDTAAFTCSGSTAIVSPAATTVVPLEETTTLLLNNRFAVDVAWKTAQGTTGHGRAVSLTSDTGYFWFFDQSNVEVIVKVLNACDFTSRFWVFAGGLTDVEVIMTVTDTVTGTVRTYTNAQGKAFQPLQDTSAFATCLSETAFALVTNPDDPLFLRATSKSGDRVEYFGEKDANGHPTSLTAVDVAFAGGDGVLISLDDQKRPSRALTRSGVPVEIQWLTDRRIVFTATSPDGSGQVTVTVDLTGSAPAAVVSHMTKPVRRRARAPLGPFMSPDRVQLELAGTTFWTPAGASTGESFVSVRRCDSPVNDALVRMHVTPQFGLGYALIGVPAGNGQYQVSIPIAPSENDELAGEICGKAAEILDLACAVTEGLGPVGGTTVCAAVGAAASALTPAAGAAVFAACEVVFVGVTLYCGTLGQSPGPGAPSLAEELCNVVPDILDRSTSQPVTLAPRAVIPGAGVFFATPQTAPGRGPFPNFQIETGDQVRIGRFFASPPDPAPFQNYAVSIEIACAPPSTVVELSIVGSDGYTDSTACVVRGDATCTLFVPGAQAGVSDTITASVNGGPSRRIVLVF